MKKMFGILVMALIGLTACDKSHTEWSYVTFVVKHSDWELAGDIDEIGSYYYCVCDVPEITQAIYDKGLIICSYRYTDDTGTNVQSILPYTEYFIDLDDYGNEFPYAMQISYNVTPTIGHRPGTIEFRVTFSDFWKDSYPPSSCRFKLTLVY